MMKSVNLVKWSIVRLDLSDTSFVTTRWALNVLAIDEIREAGEVVESMKWRGGVCTMLVYWQLMLVQQITLVRDALRVY